MRILALYLITISSILWGRGIDEPDRMLSDNPSSHVLARIAILENRNISVIIESTSNPERLPILVRNLGAILQEEIRAAEILSFTNKTLTDVLKEVAVINPDSQNIPAVWRINILSSGDDGAGSLGIHPQFLRTAVIPGVTLVTAVIVSFSGVIGFIGLASSHIARILFGSDHRLLFPASALTGALFLLVSDTLARTILGNTELPIGIITSFIGVPFLIAILMNRRKIRNAL